VAVVIENNAVAETIFHLALQSEEAPVQSGKFYMFHDLGAFLPRPISLHDAQPGRLEFLYQVKGRGTKVLSQKKTGDEVRLSGPFGKGIDFADCDSVFVGGGIGIAPLLYSVKLFKMTYPNRVASVYLGFSNEVYRTEAFRKYADELVIDIGGVITERIVIDPNLTYYSCGPEVMMRALYQRIPTDSLYVMMERRMACGVGACFACSLKTSSGMKRVCKEGPTFKGSEVFGL
jgi:dihydroorotate dehydrogenase electron transfer subunit